MSYNQYSDKYKTTNNKKKSIFFVRILNALNY